MANNIVQVIVSQILASAPNQLLSTGAIISQGGTNTAADTVTLITEPSDYTAIARTPLQIQSISWTSSVVTVQTTAAHGIPTGSVVLGDIAGVTPAGYNGTFSCTGVDATHFTYPLASNPGAETVLGTFILDAVAAVSAQVDSFFAQGNAQAIYIIELGIGTPAAGVTALGAYLQNPTKLFYLYVCPKTWDTEPTAPTLFKQYESPTSKVYFWVTTTVSTYTTWTALPIKSVVLYVESPNITTTEADAAAAAYPALATNPTAANMVAPMAFRYVFGLTPYSTLTNAQVTSLKAAGVNWIGTGAEGGISADIIINAKMGDLNPWNYWYSVDWMQINLDLALSAAIINGSNNPTNPLYYNQPGINQLQKVAQQVYNNAVTFGMAQPGGTVTAIPFLTYTSENPSDYAEGIYGGLALTFTPLRGFEQITINLVVTDIITG